MNAFSRVFRDFSLSESATRLSDGTPTAAMTIAGKDHFSSFPHAAKQARVTLATPGSLSYPDSPVTKR